MSRAPYQVLVIPYYVNDNNQIEYALFKREDDNYWQGIAGGGEDDETPPDAALREAREESGITKGKLTPLVSSVIMPVVNVSGFCWGNDVLVIPEYSFGLKVKSKSIKLSKEHLEYKWSSYEDAQKSLKWDSNHSALWELNQRIIRGHTGYEENLEAIDKSREYLKNLRTSLDEN